MNRFLKNMKRWAEGAAFFVFLLALGFSACTWEQNPVEEIEIPTDSAVSFSESIIPIFEMSCLGTGFCHDEGDKAPILTEARAYDELINGGFIDTDNPEQSILYQKIEPGASMAQYTTAQERALILQWIEEGALNN